MIEINTEIRPEVTHFFDPVSSTFSYVVKDPDSQSCAIFDSVLDLDYAAGRITFVGADKIIAYIRERNLELEWQLETHVHADHLSAAPYIQKHLGGKIAIGHNIVAVQETFGKIFNEGTEFQRDGSQFDRLLKEGDSYQIGSMSAVVIETPGHTPACMTHIMGDSAFVGDTLFMPDSGSARADFPGGDAGELYNSIMRLLSLPDETRLFMCHDYGAGGREVMSTTTVGEERLHNIHVGLSRTADGSVVTREEFVLMREARDATLKMPRLIIPSLQVNMRAGDVPLDDDGNMQLKVPINKL